MIDLIEFNQFHIITYLKVDFLLIICYLTYLTFFVNLHNLLFKSTYTINKFFKSIYIQLAISLTCDMLFPKIYIYKRVYFYLLSYI